MVEGTRLGNATEIDVIMSFGGWVAHLPFLKIDKWNLVRTGQVPGWMEKYFAADATQRGGGNACAGTTEFKDIAAALYWLFMHTKH